MYRNIKSCVKFANQTSEFFDIYHGVRQGENLSPVLFCMFLNDLNEYLTDQNCLGVNLEVQHGDILTFLKLLTLLYADDTVIFATDPVTFQRNLNVFLEYSKLWRLDINYMKTKIMIFGFRNLDNFKFELDGNIIEIVDFFKYLGVYFSKTRTFYKARKNCYDQAKKAMHLLLKKIRSLNVPLDLQLKLFDHTIVPILLYGAEIWGFENTEIIEKLHNEFLRRITGLRKSTPIYILQAELGRYTLKVNIQLRMINYWISIVNGKQNKIAYLLYKIMLNDTYTGVYQHKWVLAIKDILTSVGRYDIWLSQTIDSPLSLKRNINETLESQELQYWHGKLENSSKGLTYRIYKHAIVFEPYLKLLQESQYLPILKFRSGNHKLPVETGRWENVDYAQRTCTLCRSNKLGDEFHFLFECPTFDTIRTQYIPTFYIRRPSTYKLDLLFNTKHIQLLKKLSSFILII